MNQPFSEPCLLEICKPKVFPIFLLQLGQNCHSFCLAMSASDYVPSQDDATGPEMPDLISKQDFPDFESNGAAENIPSLSPLSATKSFSEKF